MPNDAKLGLVVGVGLVIAVAVLFRKEATVVAPEQARPTPAIAPAFPRPPRQPDAGEPEPRRPPPGTPVSRRTVREDET